MHRPFRPRSLAHRDLSACLEGGQRNAPNADGDQERDQSVRRLSCPRDVVVYLTNRGSSGMPWRESPIGMASEDAAEKAEPKDYSARSVQVRHARSSSVSKRPGTVWTIQPAPHNAFGPATDLRTACTMALSATRPASYWVAGTRRT